MKNSKTLAAMIIVLTVITTGCDNDSFVGAEETNADVVEALESDLNLSQDGSDKLVQRSDVFAFENPMSPIGWAGLKRTESDVRVGLRTGKLPVGTTLTLWWVVFNDPARCSDEVCSEDDVFVDPVTPRTTVIYGGGRVVGRNGRVSFSDKLLESGTSNETIVGPYGPTHLEDSFKSEIHAVVRSHGPAIEGLVEEQIGSFAGGCEVFKDAGEADPTALKECGDLQFAIFPPAN